MDLGLDGRTALVTGASSGIGLALSRMLAAEGATVVMAARGEERLRAVAADVDGAVALVLDVTDSDAGERALDVATQAGGRLDVVVNNAGTSFARAPEDLTDDDWLDQYALHVLGPMRLMRAACPAMAQAGWGRVVNVCSSAGKRPSQTNVAYSVTKAAQLSLSRAWADAWAPRGVLVNAVAPGPVSSELWLADGGLADQNAASKGIDRDDALRQQAARVPLGRFAEPEEIAAVCLFLCSQAASTVAGAAWSADGGAVPVIL